MVAIVIALISVLVAVLGTCLVASPMTVDYRVGGGILLAIGILSISLSFLWLRWPKKMKGLSFVGELTGFGIYSNKSVFKKEKDKITFGDGSTVIFEQEEVFVYDELFDEEWIQIDNKHPTEPILVFDRIRSEHISGKRVRRQR